MTNALLALVMILDALYSYGGRRILCACCVLSRGTDELANGRRFKPKSGTMISPEVAIRRTYKISASPDDIGYDLILSSHSLNFTSKPQK